MAAVLPKGCIHPPVSLTCDTAGFTRGMKRARAQMSRLQRRMSRDRVLGYEHRDRPNGPTRSKRRAAM